MTAVFQSLANLAIECFVLSHDSTLYFFTLDSVEGGLLTREAVNDAMLEPHWRRSLQQGRSLGENCQVEGSDLTSLRVQDWGTVAIFVGSGLLTVATAGVTAGCIHSLVLKLVVVAQWIGSALPDVTTWFGTGGGSSGAYPSPFVEPRSAMELVIATHRFLTRYNPDAELLARERPEAARLGIFDMVADNFSIAYSVRPSVTSHIHWDSAGMTYEPAQLASRFISELSAAWPTISQVLQVEASTWFGNVVAVVTAPHMGPLLILPLVAIFSLYWWSTVGSALFLMGAAIALDNAILFVQSLIIIAFATLLERKGMGIGQHRFGPNVVGYAGLLQPLADGLKLFLKEPIIPRKANFSLFVAAPMLALILALYSWYLIPISQHSHSDLALGLLYVLVVSVLEIYGIVFAGWSSNSKYALLGGLRSTAQMISYEIALSFVFLNVVYFASSFNLTDFVNQQRHTIWNMFPLLPITIVFLISMLAETNRTPFDLPEGESELVAGFHVEYAGMLFALFFLAEYSNMMLLSALAALLFFGGWLVGRFLFLSGFFAGCTLGSKVVTLLAGFIWVRATFPRLRYDQLMELGWKVFLPFAFSYFVIIFFSLYQSGHVPQSPDWFASFTQFIALLY